MSLATKSKALFLFQLIHYQSFKPVFMNLKKFLSVFLAATTTLVLSAQTGTDVAPTSAKPSRDSIYMIAETMPEFAGGNKEVPGFLSKNVKMPQACRDERVGGMAVVEFVVEKDGTPSNFKIAVSTQDRYENEPAQKKLAKLLDEEALRLARLMPKWSVATIGGEPVRVRMRLPVKFTAW